MICECNREKYKDYEYCKSIKCHIIEWLLKNGYSITHDS